MKRFIAYGILTLLGAVLVFSLLRWHHKSSTQTSLAPGSIVTNRSGFFSFVKKNGAVFSVPLPTRESAIQLRDAEFDENVEWRESK